MAPKPSRTPGVEDRMHGLIHSAIIAYYLYFERDVVYDISYDTSYGLEHPKPWGCTNTMSIDMNV